MSNFDHILSKIEFSFKAGCRADFDCVTDNICVPSQIEEEPDIDYQAKDFASFRRLILDYLSTRMPEWKERNPADIGIVLIELLCYLGDHLSYSQDAKSTEAYLSTARKRISIKRHARLVDYFLHDGCNARAWVYIEMSDDRRRRGEFVIPKQTKLLTKATELESHDSVMLSDKFEEAITKGAEAFETMHDVTIYHSHNNMLFYTWGESQCCLPRGATSATLRNDGYKLDLFLFTWGNILRSPPEAKDVERLTKFLKTDIGLDWVADNPSIKFRSISDTLVQLSDGRKFLYALLNPERNQVIIARDKEGASRICEFAVRKEDGKLNAYSLSLKPGDVLLFEEISSPTTGRPEDANVAHRHFVRLSTVNRNYDKLFRIPLVDISWNFLDALPFPLCIEIAPSIVAGGIFTDRKTISIARGNIVLADHGYRIVKSIDPSLIQDRDLFFSYDGIFDASAFDDPKFAIEIRKSLDLSKVEATEFLGYSPFSFSGKRKFRPHLSQKQLTFSVPYDQSLPASAAFVYDVHNARPDITLRGEGKIWTPSRDLLQSREFDNNFVVETENDGTAFIRFGDFFDNSSSSSPIFGSGSLFYATYRIGNGGRGNVGAESIAQIVLDDRVESATLITQVRNPLAASGGREPEDIELCRRFAPEAFRTQERAVTQSDYIEILKSHPEVQNASANIRWTGSWYTVFIAVDRLGGKVVDSDFKNSIIDHVNKYRLAGYDLEIQEPIYVPLHILIDICIKPGYSPTDVKKKFAEAFSSHDNLDGTRGFFHPDNLSFGQPVMLSKIYESAMGISGVGSCTVDVFQRWGKIPNEEISKGMIQMNNNEIPRLDNDSNFPENGKIEFTFGGLEIPKRRGL